MATRFGVAASVSQKSIVESRGELFSEVALQSVTRRRSPGR